MLFMVNCKVLLREILIFLVLRLINFKRKSVLTWKMLKVIFKVNFENVGYISNSCSCIKLKHSKGQWKKNTWIFTSNIHPNIVFRNHSNAWMIKYLLTLCRWHKIFFFCQKFLMHSIHICNRHCATLWTLCCIFSCLWCILVHSKHSIQ